MLNIEDIKKKIIYKAKSLGYRELNLIFQSFIDQHINKLRINELELLLKLISKDDQALFDLFIKNQHDIKSQLTSFIQKK